MADTTTTIKVWVKIDNNDPEKVEIRSDSDVDDLKSELFNRNKEEKRKYYGIFNNEKLASSARVSHSTTGERPILFFKADESYRENNSNDEDATRVTGTYSNAGKQAQSVSYTSSTKYSRSNVLCDVHLSKELGLFYKVILASSN
jgi:hypothetical protein